MKERNPIHRLNIIVWFLLPVSGLVCVCSVYLFCIYFYIPSKSIIIYSLYGLFMRFFFLHLLCSLLEYFASCKQTYIIYIVHLKTWHVDTQRMSNIIDKLIWMPTISIWAPSGSMVLWLRRAKPPLRLCAILEQIMYMKYAR